MGSLFINTLRILSCLVDGKFVFFGHAKSTPLKRGFKEYMERFWDIPCDSNPTPANDDRIAIIREFSNYLGNGGPDLQVRFVVIFGLCQQ